MFFFCWQNSAASTFQRCKIDCTCGGRSWSRNILCRKYCSAGFNILDSISMIITFIFIMLASSSLPECIQCHGSRTDTQNISGHQSHAFCFLFVLVHHLRLPIISRNALSCSVLLLKRDVKSGRTSFSIKLLLTDVLAKPDYKGVGISKPPPMAGKRKTHVVFPSDISLLPLADGMSLRQLRCCYNANWEELAFIGCSE